MIMDFFDFNFLIMWMVLNHDMRKGTKGLGWTCPSELGVDPWRFKPSENGATSADPGCLLLHKKEMNHDERMMIG